MRFNYYVFLGVLSFFGLGGQSIGAPSVTDGRSTLSAEELKTALLAVPSPLRARITADKTALAGFARTLMQEQRIAAAAKKSGYADTAEIRAVTEKAARDALVSRYLDDQIARTTSAEPNLSALARERFEVTRKDFVRPEAVRVAHILIAVDVEDERFSEEAMRAKAEEVLTSLREGADFAKLAKEFSGDRSSFANGGELPGWVERGRLAPPFEKMAFALKPGETSGLVRTRYGFHIVKKLDHRKETLKEFSEVEAELMAKLRAEFQNQGREEVLKPFAGTQPVVIDDALFAALKGD
jgi:peptidyl-prolyl cis-trans isomerase C